MFDRIWGGGGGKDRKARRGRKIKNKKGIKKMTRFTIRERKNFYRKS